MRGLAHRRWVAGVLGAALLTVGLTACGSDSQPAASGTVKIFGCQPENPLVPGNTNEVCGGNVLDAVFTGLVNYNPDTAQPQNAVATSIESSDNVTWTIKINDDYTFSDGTKVTAQSFVNSWNWTADENNGALNGYYMCAIEGAAKTSPVTCAGADEGTKPTATTLSGLKVVNDTEFTVKLTSPASSFPVQLGYIAFAPLPQSFFDDPTAFGKQPIGNGPFKVVSGTPDKGFTLEAVDGYVGPDKPKVKTVEFKTYQSPQAAYADMQADNLDFMDQVPDSALKNDTYQKDFPDRFVNKPIGVIQTATLPLYNDNYKDDPNLAKALSLAIDRKAIVEKVFNNGRTPATGWVSPVVEGYKAGACGEFCEYDAAKAKEFLAKADYKGPFTFATNSDGPGNVAAATAICNSIKNALDVACTAKVYVDFKTLRTDVNDKKMTSMFRTGWQMDYPSMENFLAPLYVTNASANDGGYSNQQFDDLITKAAGENGDAALATYQQSESILAETMPVIPLWYQAQQSVWSTKVSNVKVTPFGTLDLSSITLNS